MPGIRMASVLWRMVTMTWFRVRGTARERISPALFPGFSRVCSAYRCLPVFHIEEDQGGKDRRQVSPARAPAAARAAVGTICFSCATP